jgi:hypothetical protein
MLLSYRINLVKLEIKILGMTYNSGWREYLLIVKKIELPLPCCKLPESNIENQRLLRFDRSFV